MTQENYIYQRRKESNNKTVVKMLEEIKNQANIAIKALEKDDAEHKADWALEEIESYTEKAIQKLINFHKEHNQSAKIKRTCELYYPEDLFSPVSDPMYQKSVHELNLSQCRRAYALNSSQCVRGKIHQTTHDIPLPAQQDAQNCTNQKNSFLKPVHDTECQSTQL